ncbi:MAG: MSMEG_4193 family putative phosphomutase [Chloroflexi bacterium]|nr:MSMEG_4193 family putative phosphomutase [Chloroflexota bacterium]
MAATTFVLLIRHGENEFVATHRLAGRLPGVQLNERGVAQAAQLVEFLQEQPLAALYSSPLLRCLETARPLAAARALPVGEDPAFLEVDYGEWQGADLRELSKLPEWHKVQHAPSTFRFPQGETLREVQHRAVTGLDSLRVQHPNAVIALFAHGDVIRTMLAHYLGVPLDLFQRIVIQTASVSVLSFVDDHPAVLGMNCLARLPRIELKPSPEKGEEGGVPATGSAGTNR